MEEHLIVLLERLMLPDQVDVLGLELRIIELTIRQLTCKERPVVATVRASRLLVRSLDLLFDLIWVS